MGLSSIWAHLLVTQDWSQKGFSSEMRVVCWVFFGQEPLIFSPNSVVLTCLCTCHVTNRTFGFIWDCWVFLTGINIKPRGPEDQHYNGTLQSASKTPPGYSSTGIALFWWEAKEAGKPMTRLAFQFISTLWKDWVPMSPVQSTDTTLNFTSAAEDKRLFRGCKSWHIVVNMVVAHSKNSSAVLPLQWLLIFYSC